MKLEYYRHLLQKKCSNIKLHKNPSSGSRNVPCGQTDRQTDMNKLMSLYYQSDAQILYFNTLITLLYMFLALLCSSSGGQIVLVQHLISSLSSYDCSVHRLRESSRDECTEQSPKESDDTRCCINTIVLLKMSTIVLETCRGV